MNERMDLSRAERVGRMLTCTTPAAKPAIPPRNARSRDFFMTSPKVSFFFSATAFPDTSPRTGIGDRLRSAAVIPWVIEAKRGARARPRTVKVLRSMSCSVAILEVEGRGSAGGELAPLWRGMDKA